MEGTLLKVAIRAQLYDVKIKTTGNLTFNWKDTQKNKNKKFHKCIRNENMQRELEEAQNK